MGLNPGGTDKLKKPVRQLLADGTHVDYNSVKDAAQGTGALRSNIQRACGSDQRTAGGYRWKYIEETVEPAKTADESVDEPGLYLDSTPNTKNAGANFSDDDPLWGELGLGSAIQDSDPLWTDLSLNLSGIADDDPLWADIGL
jgi:hypothetical protein